MIRNNKIKREAIYRIKNQNWKNDLNNIIDIAVENISANIDDIKKIFEMKYIGSGITFIIDINLNKQIKYKPMHELPFDFIEKYADLLNWEYIGSRRVLNGEIYLPTYKKIALNAYMFLNICLLGIPEVIRVLNFRTLCNSLPFDELPEEFLENFKDYINWKNIGLGKTTFNGCYYKSIDEFKPEFLEKYSNYINWKNIGNTLYGYTEIKSLSKDFIFRFYDKSDKLQFEYNVLKYNRNFQQNELGKKQIPKEIIDIICDFQGLD